MTSRPLQTFGMVCGAVLFVAAGAGIAAGANSFRADPKKELAGVRTSLPPGVDEVDCESMRLKLIGEPKVYDTLVHRCFTTTDAESMQDYRAVRNWIQAQGYRQTGTSLENPTTGVAMDLHKRSASGVMVTLIPGFFSKAYDRSTRTVTDGVRYIEVSGTTAKKIDESAQQLD